jgi:hypothetical protein
VKIGLDYGGVMDNDPEGWIVTIQRLIDLGHQVYLISHCHPGEYDHNRRQYVCDKSGAINLSFSDTMDEAIIRQRKAQIVQEYQIELFVDDYIDRCLAVQRLVPTCTCICAHYTRWSVAKSLLDGLGY